MESQLTKLQLDAPTGVAQTLDQGLAPPPEKGAIGIALLVWLFGGGLGLAVLIFILLKIF